MIETNQSALVEKASKINIAISTLKIVNQESYNGAKYLRENVKGLIKEIEDTFDPIISKMNIAHKEACTQKRKHRDPLVGTLGQIDAQLLTFDTEQERIRKDAEQKVREKAAKEAEKLEKKAEKLRDEGKDEKADIMQDRAETVPIPTVEPTYQKPKGITYRETWKGRVINEKILLRQFTMPNQKSIDAQARATKNTMKYPGIEFYCVRTVAESGR